MRRTSEKQKWKYASSDRLRNPTNKNNRKTRAQNNSNSHNDNNSNNRKQQKTNVRLYQHHYQPATRIAITVARALHMIRDNNGDCTTVVPATMSPRQRASFTRPPCGRSPPPEAGRCCPRRKQRSAALWSRDWRRADAGKSKRATWMGSRGCTDGFSGERGESRPRHVRLLVLYLLMGLSGYRFWPNVHTNTKNVR